jgi:hypothetical protein
MKAETTRTHKIQVRLSDGEKDYIETKFKASGKKSLSEYIRLQACHGNVFLVDESHFTEIKRDLAGACNNINQVAFQANKTRGVSSEFYAELERNRKIIHDVFKRVESLQNYLEGYAEESWL